jgi:ATP/maltotriose-dependent transcriptional regulator MalT
MAVAVPAQTRYSVAYMVAADIADDVAALLASYQVTAVNFTRPGQIPHFAVQAATAEPRALPDSLTEREFQVLALIAQGMSNGEIGERLFLAEDTIKTHCRRMFRKLGVKARGQAVAVGYERGLLGQAVA